MAQRGLVLNRSGDVYKPSVLRGYEMSLRLRVVLALGQANSQTSGVRTLGQLYEPLIPRPAPMRSSRDGRDSAPDRPAEARKPPLRYGRNSCVEGSKCADSIAFRPIFLAPWGVTVSARFRLWNRENGHDANGDL